MELRAGTRVKSPTFGEGTVQSMAGAAVARILFQREGLLTMNTELAPLEVLDEDGELKEEPMNGEPLPVDEIRRLAAQGKNAVEIAAATGRQAGTVRAFARRQGIALALAPRGHRQASENGNGRPAQRASRKPAANGNGGAGDMKQLAVDEMLGWIDRRIEKLQAARAAIAELMP